MKTDADFRSAIARADLTMQVASELVLNERWQGIDTSSKPEMATHEIRHFHMQVPMLDDLGALRQSIEPNVPWADNHFEERVCGQPINPGVEWATWPYAHKAASFLVDGKFNHNYMERYWPKHAGEITPSLVADDYKDLLKENEYTDGGIRMGNEPLRGIYHEYGDLKDVVAQLVNEPTTRQAVLPVFFPEDTGAIHRSRVPCSLHYHFMMRNGALDVSYALRSCDLMRHFRDDIYLTARLLLWVLDEARKMDKGWRRVRPGDFIMQISSLHCFRNDYRLMFGSK